jgi:transposase
VPTPSLDQLRKTDRDAVATLRELLAEGHTDAVMKIITQLLARNAELELKLAGKRAEFKSTEAVSTEQLLLQLKSHPDATDEQLAEADAKLAKLVTPVPAEPLTPQPPKAPRVRKPFPASLPRQQTVIRVPDDQRACPSCGAERTCIGHDISELLELIPAQLFVRQNLRELLVCKPCDSAPIRAPTGDNVVSGGRFGQSLVAQLLVDKYRDGLPLHRQRERFERIGFEIAVSSLMDQVKWSAELLKPLQEALLRQVLESEVMQLDATGLDVLKEGRGDPKLGSVWAYVGRTAGKLRVACLYTATGKAVGQREGERGPADVLAKREGLVLADAAGVFDASFKREGIIECGCNAHARRYFVRALDAGDERAALPIAAFKKLYEVEAEFWGRAPAEVLAARRERSKPVYDELLAWLAAHKPHEPPASLMGKALQYLHNHQLALRRFLDDGRIPIDNNDTERVQIRTALTRKNFLFAGSDAGAERAAIIWSVLASCIAAGVEPVAYLRDVLPKLARRVRIKDVPDLLPQAWKLRHGDDPLPVAPPGAISLPAIDELE